MFAQEEATRAWTTEERAGLKEQVVPVMMALAGEPALQVQIGEAIALMAETDFPHEWDSLIGVRRLPSLRAYASNSFGQHSN